VGVQTIPTRKMVAPRRLFSGTKGSVTWMKSALSLRRGAIFPSAPIGISRKTKSPLFQNSFFLCLHCKSLQSFSVVPNNSSRDSFEIQPFSSVNLLMMIVSVFFFVVQVLASATSGVPNREYDVRFREASRALGASSRQFHDRPRKERRILTKARPVVQCEQPVKYEYWASSNRIECTLNGGFTDFLIIHP